MIDWTQEGKRLVSKLAWLRDHANEMALPEAFAQSGFRVTEECPDPKRAVAVAFDLDGSTGIAAMAGWRTTLKQSRSEPWEVGIELHRPSAVWEYPEIDHELDWRPIRWGLATDIAAIEIAITFVRDRMAERMGAFGRLQRQR